MNPNILGVIGPGFLNQVPTLYRLRSTRFKASIHPFIHPCIRTRKRAQRLLYWLPGQLLMKNPDLPEPWRPFSATQAKATPHRQCLSLGQVLVQQLSSRVKRHFSSFSVQRDRNDTISYDPG